MVVQRWTLLHNIDFLLFSKDLSLKEFFVCVIDSILDYALWTNRQVFHEEEAHRKSLLDLSHWLYCSNF